MAKVLLTATILCFVLLIQGQVRTPEMMPSRTTALRKQLAVAKDNIAKDSILHKLAEAYIWHKPDSALFYTEQRISLAQALKSPQLEAYATGYYGYILGLMANYPLGIKYLLEGLKMAEEQPVAENLDFFFDALSNTYMEQGDFTNARLYADKFESISIRNNDTLFYGWLLTKGVLFDKLGHDDSALLYLRKAYDFDIRENGKVTRERTLLTLANVLRRNRIYPAALSNYRKAINVATERNQFVNLADANNGIAQLYYDTGDWDSGIYYSNEALRQSQAVLYTLGQLTAHSTLATLYKEKEDKDSTLKHLEATISLRDSLFSQQKERAVQNLSFNEQMRQRDILETQEQLRNQAKIFGLVAGMVALLIIAGILYRNNQNKQKAYSRLQKQKTETERERAKAERALEELKATQLQLIQREKMASLGELTAGIAHEIQNPLNFVNNFSELSLELTDDLKGEINKLPLPEKEKEPVLSLINEITQNHQKINHHGNRADSIVKNMLQHSLRSSGRKEFVDINRLTDEYLRLSYHGFMAKDENFNAVLNTNLDANVGKVSIVPQEIGKVLLNIFNNAFYFVTEKKKRLNSVFEPTISVSTRKCSGKIEIIVRDNGTGIPQNIVGKIYQPFFTTKPTGKGTGLGLSLSYDIVAKTHGGEIKVATKEGEYTEFTVVLPV